MKKPKDLEYINSSDMEELMWWSVQLSIPPEKLLGIIAQNGPAVSTVKKTARNGKPGAHF